MSQVFTKRTTETLRDIAGDVVRLLRQSGETVGVAESLTGGGVMAAITSVGGASAVFRGGVVSYATDLKRQLLGVDPDLIARHGVIHGDVARQMAAGARGITTTTTSTIAPDQNEGNGEQAEGKGDSVTWGIGTTGVAGPDMQDGKPVGTVFIGIASPERSWSLGPFFFPGDRDQIRQATISEALSQFRDVLRSRAEKDPSEVDN